ncbi:hypothetical protein [Streptomyces sp. NPDC060205]|uniref:hypothetical protein n=1 Tax=Streptomyces sp. NPDC060205 TaxID=3347072 RepID=UPI00364F3438
MTRAFCIQSQPTDDQQDDRMPAPDHDHDHGSGKDGVPGGSIGFEVMGTAGHRQPGTAH